MGEGLAEADILTRLFMLACIFMAFIRFSMQMTELKNFTGLLHDLKIRLGDNFEVTKEQGVSILTTSFYNNSRALMLGQKMIRRIAKDLILDESRPRYLDLYIDVNVSDA